MIQRINSQMPISLLDQVPVHARERRVRSEASREALQRERLAFVWEVAADGDHSRPRHVEFSSRLPCECFRGWTSF